MLTGSQEAETREEQTGSPYARVQEGKTAGTMRRRPEISGRVRCEEAASRYKSGRSKKGERCKPARVRQTDAMMTRRVGSQY